MSGATTILIVEDDKHFASQLKELMEFNGHTAVLAYTGPDGVAQFQKNPVDFVLMDVMLPNVHGIRVLEQIRQESGGADVPVILMSAVYRSESLFSKDMRRLGVLSFLSKPFSLIDLGRKIQNLLDLPLKGREEVRGALAEARASASITGFVPTVEEEEEAAAPEPPRPTPVASASTPYPGPPGPVPSAGPSLSEIPAVMRAPRVVELDDGDSFVRVDTSRRLPKIGQLTAGVYVKMLTTLFHSHSSGRLDLEARGIRRTVFLLNGYPVWIEVDPELSGLPVFLQDEGLLEPSQLSELTLAARRGRGTVRKLLVDLNLVKAQDLDAVLEAWISAEVRDAMGRPAQFKFVRSDDFAGSIPVYEINPIRALWDALPRHVTTHEIRNELDSLADRSVGRTRTFNRLFGYIATGASLRSLGEALSQPRSIAEVRARFPDEDGGISRCLWFLIHAGLVALSDSPTADSKQTIREWIASPKPNRAPPTPVSRPASRVPDRARVVQEAASSGSHTVEFQTGRYGKEIVDKLLRKTGTLPDSAAEREATIVRDYVTRMDLDHYAFLDVPRTATAEEIDQAYQSLAPRYRLRNLGTNVQGDSRRKAKELLTRLVRVFDELSDPARRAGYDARLEREERIDSGRSRSPGSTARMPSVSDDDLAGSSLGDLPALEEDWAEAADVFWWPGSNDASQLSRRRGRMDKFDGQVLAKAHSAMAKQEFAEAAALLEELRGAYPSDAALLAELGWCRFALAPKDHRAVDKALEWTDLGLAFQPDSLSALEVKARILAATDRDEEALSALKRLARHQPGSDWVRQQLAQRDSAEPETARGTGLRKLWGRRK